MNNKNFIEKIAIKYFPKHLEQVLDNPLIKYIYHKTKSVHKSSKSRGSFGNLYAIYVLVEDYIKYTSQSAIPYSEYEGMKFIQAFNRQRELPFGEKLQNHALNHRCNEEFLKFFPSYRSDPPILRDKEHNRYWINEKLLLIEVDQNQLNVSKLIIEIINRYIQLKRESFTLFFESLVAFQKTKDGFN